MTDGPNRIEALFESPEVRRGFAWVLGVMLAVTLLKGFRLPNQYSATHFVFNYSSGFVRRGLVGETMQRLLGARAFTYGTFVAFAFALFGLATLALVLCVRRVAAAAPTDPVFRCALLVFVSSPALVFLVHLVGYLDYIGLIAVLFVLLWSCRSRSRYALFYAIAACTVAFAFIHEILAVMFVPMFCFVMLCHLLRHWPTQTRQQRSLMFVHAAFVVLIAFGLSGVVSTRGTRDAATIAKLHATLVTKVDFGLRWDAFEALSRSSADNASSLMPWYWKHNVHALGAPKAWLASLPSVLFLLRYGIFLVRNVAFASWGRWLLGLAMLAAVAAPQALNLVGWDWNRWNAISLLACFCCVLATRLYFPGQSAAKGATASMATAAICVCILSLASDVELFDNLKIQFFPFYEQVEFLRSLLNPGFKYRPPI
jgi:hypothetical protein